MRRLRRRCGYVGVRVGEASNPGPGMQLVNEEQENNDAAFGNAIQLAILEDRMITKNRRQVRKISRMYIRKGPWYSMTTPARCNGPGEDQCRANAYVHVVDEYVGLPSLRKVWRPRLKVLMSGSSRDWLQRRRVDLQFQANKRRYLLHRLCGYAWGRRGARYQNLTWAAFYPRHPPAGGHRLEVDHVDGDCYCVDADRCSQHPRNPVASTAER